MKMLIGKNLSSQELIEIVGQHFMEKNKISLEAPAAAQIQVRSFPNGDISHFRFEMQIEQKQDA